MKKLVMLAAAFAAVAFVACGGKQSAQTAEETDSVKSFEQTQIEEKIKVELDSLGAALGQLKQLPIIQKRENGIELTEQEKQVKPEWLFDPAVAEDATTLAEKYRMISALSVDKAIANLYDMPTDEYEKAISKLVADVNDPSFKDLDTEASIFEVSETIYNKMEENGRINYFWQLAATSLVEELFAMTQNTEKFISVFDDESASNVTYRIVLLIDAINRLTEYDPDLVPVANAIAPLNVLNAINVEQLKTQIGEAKTQIADARKALIK